MSNARILADWTSLTSDTIGVIFISARPRGPSRDWPVIVATAAPDSLILEACEEAQAHHFLPEFARLIIKNEESVGRSKEDISALLNNADNLLGSGMAQALMIDARGFMNAAILPTIVKATHACARVRLSNPGNTPVGSAFLVRSDIVLTAAHVALDKDVPAATWKDSLRPGLEFEFANGPDGNGATQKVKPAANGALLSFAWPHSSVKLVLNTNVSAPANENLDFALIRLERPVHGIDPIAINDRATVEVGAPCWAFGYLPSADLSFDVNSVTWEDEFSGRWRHRANTGDGMSGGCCINHLGELAGVHEGGVKDAARTKNPDDDYNRGVKIAAIRKRQRADGRDPLAAMANLPVVEMRDAALVEQLYKAGVALSSPSVQQGWREAFQDKLGLVPDGTVPLPPFHPWFRRKDFERWAAANASSAQLAFVYGERGAGKSFCVDILRAHLNPAANDLMALNATQTRALDWKDTMAHAVDLADQEFRTNAASIRYSDTDAVIADLTKRHMLTKRTRHLVLDFGYPGYGNRFEESPWHELVIKLLMNEWVRVVLIGLPKEERDAFSVKIVSADATANVGVEEFEMEHVRQLEFMSFAKNLAKARSTTIDGEQLNSIVEEMFELLDRPEMTDMRTCWPALFGIRLEREL